VLVSVLMRTLGSSFGFFACRKRRCLRKGDDGSSFTFDLGTQELISGKANRARGCAEERGELEPCREVANMEEHDDPTGLGVAIGMEATCFTGGGRPALQRAITSP
jgi:hypothetical protein